MDKDQFKAMVEMGKEDFEVIEFICERATDYALEIGVKNGDWFNEEAIDAYCVGLIQCLKESIEGRVKI